MKYKLFLDLDGVLADFNKGYFELTGRQASHVQGGEAEHNMWRVIAHVGNFYLNLEPMEDADLLWRGTRNCSPTILTGIPDILNAEEQKRAWVRKWLNAEVPVVCCKSKEKIFKAKELCHNGEIPVLVDDWPKYKNVWEENGGIFILHTSAISSLEALKDFDF